MSWPAWRPGSGTDGSLGGRLVAIVLLGSWLARLAGGFAIVGYVPEYQFDHLDWNLAVQRTTHLVLFSAWPTADGELHNLERFWLLRQQSSGLRVAMRRSSMPPKVLLSIGGAGRSDHFKAVTANKKARRKLARRIVSFMVDNSILAGVDLDWEAPSTQDEWRNLGKLAQEIRMEADEKESLLGRHMVLTFSYHPNSRSVALFAGLHSKGSGRPFVSYFDLCHVMAYSQLDNERRHSTQRLAKMAVDEWLEHKLPPHLLTLGLPFYGISRQTGQYETYSALTEREPSLVKNVEADESSDGVYFNNGNTLAKKVRFALRRKLGGVMVWELGQDKKGHLLRHIHEAVIQFLRTEGAAEGRQEAMPPEPRDDWLARLWRFLPTTEDNVIAGVAGIAGAYLFMKASILSVPVYDRAPRTPEERERRRKNQLVAEEAMAAGEEDEEEEEEEQQEPQRGEAEAAAAEPSAVDPEADPDEHS